MVRKWFCMLLTMVMVLTGVSALAETTKHERVYAVTTADGTLCSLTDSVRLENADSLAELVDRTSLTNVENVGGDEGFTLEGETLTWRAEGKDIVYQGTSDQPLPITPVVTLRLDGQEISAEDLGGKTGRAEVTVTYSQPEAIPHLAATLLLLPETGVSSLTLENAMLISFSGRQAILGWAVPGADESLSLPASFTVAFDADHAALGWLMTFASADPIDLLCGELDCRLPVDIRVEMAEAETLLNALQAGEALPETAGLTKELPAKINELNDGLTALDDGAKQLADGAKKLNMGLGMSVAGTNQLQKGAGDLADGSQTLLDGAKDLKTGLETLSGNSAALNEGAQAIFTAVLQTANQQLAAAGLDQAGLSLPELTAENYEAVLSGAIGKLAQVPAARQSLPALLDQLNQVKTFTEGLNAYTAGVDQAAAGAGDLADGAAGVRDGAKSVSRGITSLATGMGTVSSGAKQLADGAARLRDEGTSVLRDSLLGAEKDAAEKLLPLLTGEGAEALQIYESTRDAAKKTGYDLRPEGMRTVTVYIIRTDL